MIECGKITKKDLASIIKCNPKDVEAIKRKLIAYGVVFDYNPKTETFNITETGDRFRQACVWKYGFANQMDWNKFALYLYLVFVADIDGVDFNSMPTEQLAYEIDKRYHIKICSKTLQKYRKRLIEKGFSAIGDPKYVLVDPLDNSYIEIDAKTYAAGWRYYFKMKAVYSSNPDTCANASAFAYSNLQLEYGGHLRKHYTLIGSAFTKEELKELTDLATEKVIKNGLDKADY